MTVQDVVFDAGTGLAPAIVQDARTGDVLMLGYVSPETLQLSVDTGFVHFWSRSRKEIWRKGATSGNTFTLESVSVDCDRDAVLFEVVPAGPACHRGTTTCFDDIGGPGEQPRPSFGELRRLWATIEHRARHRPKGSYTARLIDGGVDATGRKIVEEATEVLLAAKDHASGGEEARLDEEAADLLYHLLVLLAERGLSPAGALDVLRERASSR